MREVTTCKDTEATVDVGSGQIVTEVFGIEQTFTTPNMPTNRYRGNCIVEGSLYTVYSTNRRDWKTKQMLESASANKTL